MRVSFVASGLDSGGAEFALLRLLTAMRRYDVDAMVVSLRSQGVVGPQLREASIPVACLDLPALGALIGASPALNEQIRAWTPAVLHGWMFMIYLVTVLDLSLRCKWNVFPRTVLVMLAGTIPFFSFYAEHKATGWARDYMAAHPEKTGRPVSGAESTPADN